MRKNIKTCIYAVTAILPVILSACSNKADDTNTPKSVKEGTTIFVEDISSDITSSHVENTTEEDTTELISETEQETLNSEDITSQQEVQTDIQQITTVTSVNSTPAPIQNNEQPVIQTTPMPTTTTTLIPLDTDMSIPTETTTPEGYKNPSFVIKGIGEKYIYNDENGCMNIFTIDSANYALLDESYFINGYFSKIKLRLVINISILENYSPVHCKYSIYNSNSICIATGSVDFSYQSSTSKTAGASFFVNDLPPDDYTIVFSNYE